jgi:hypothetical protein
MPFARHSGYSFSAVSVRQNAPPCGGVYGLSNADGWVYIHLTENIQGALLNHLNQRTHGNGFRTATGFTFEVCEPEQRMERCIRLVQELRPAQNGHA